MFGLFHHGMRPLANFQADYKVYPISFIDKPDAENGDKVFMPPSALHRLCAHLPAFGPCPVLKLRLTHGLLCTYFMIVMYLSVRDEEQSAICRAFIGA